MKLPSSLTCLLALLCAFAGAFAAGSAFAGVSTGNAHAAEVVWHDAAAKDWRPEGRAWDDTPTPFARLSNRAKGKVPGGVWSLSLNSAGIVYRFKTNAPTVRVRVTTGGSLAMPHMTAVGVSGVDLYARGEDTGGAWRWAGATKPSAKHTDTALFDGAKPLPREFALYLPLYNNTVALAVGVPAGSTFETLPPRSAKPLVFYGTSILHGCSASRPGMTIPALLGRWLDTPTVNLGFSGSGRMETALADVLGEIDAAAYVLDCLPNMHYGMPPAEVERRTLAFVKRLREKRPTVPVVLVEDRTLGNAWLLPRLQREHKQTRAAYRAAFEKLVAGGVKNLRYIAGARLIGDDDEATIDASHLTDLGMWRQAKALVPVLKEATSNLQPSTLNERPAAAAGTDIYLRFREPTSPAVPVERLENWKFTETAIIICDMWDRHWCDHLNANLNELTPALAEVVKAARAKGVKIVHAPSDITEKFYKEHPARLAAKKFNTGGRNAWVHKFLDTEKGTPWPLDTRDQGCPDCWKKMRGRYLVWKQQDKRIDIAAGDIISERNDEVVGWLRANGVKNVILTGVATNMCVIGRPFGLRAMHLAGFNTVLMRDMTDVMYNQQYPSVLPAGKGTAPFVSHFAGLDLMVNYIEAHVCPTVVSTPFTGKPPFKFPSDKR